MKKEYKSVEKFTITDRTFYWYAFLCIIGIANLMMFMYGLLNNWSLTSPVMVINGIAGIANFTLGTRILETFEFKKTLVELTAAEKLLGERS